MFGHTCVLVYKQKKLRCAKAEGARDFPELEGSHCYVLFVGMKLVPATRKIRNRLLISATTEDIAKCLSSAIAKERKVNRNCFLNLLSTPHFLAR